MLQNPGEQARHASPLPKKEKLRVPAVEILPSDRFSFLVHMDVMKRFVALSHNGTQAIDAPRVEGEGVPSQAASLNVRYLKSIGLLTRTDRGQYLPTQEAIKFVTYRTVSDDKARPVLASLIGSTWMVSTAQNVLSPTKATKDEVLLGELAIAAQTDKEKKKPALRVLIDYLLFSGVIRVEGDGLVLAGSQAEISQPTESSSVRTEIPGILLPSGSGSEQLGKEWLLIQTEDFTLRIRSSPESVDYLLEYVPTLRRKIERILSKQEAANQIITSGSS